jgi:hypothetical protein
MLVFPDIIQLISSFLDDPSRLNWISTCKTFSEKYYGIPVVLNVGFRFIRRKVFPSLEHYAALSSSGIQFESPRMFTLNNVDHFNSHLFKGLAFCDSSFSSFIKSCGDQRWFTYTLNSLVLIIEKFESNDFMLLKEFKTLKYLYLYSHMEKSCELGPDFFKDFEHLIELEFTHIMCPKTLNLPSNLQKLVIWECKNPKIINISECTRLQYL